MLFACFNITMLTASSLADFVGKGHFKKVETYLNRKIKFNTAAQI